MKDYKFYSVSYNWYYSKSRSFRKVLYGTYEDVVKWVEDHKKTITSETPDWYINQIKNYRIDKEITIKECSIPYIDLANGENH